MRSCLFITIHLGRIAQRSVQRKSAPRPTPPATRHLLSSPRNTVLYSATHTQQEARQTGVRIGYSIRYNQPCWRGPHHSVLSSRHPPTHSCHMRTQVVHMSHVAYIQTRLLCVPCGQFAGRRVHEFVMGVQQSREYVEQRQRQRGDGERGGEKEREGGRERGREGERESLG